MRPCADQLIKLQSTAVSQLVDALADSQAGWHQGVDLGLTVAENGFLKHAEHFAKAAALREHGLQNGAVRGGFDVRVEQ